MSVLKLETESCRCKSHILNTHFCFLAMTYSDSPFFIGFFGLCILKATQSNAVLWAIIGSFFCLCILKATWRNVCILITTTQGRKWLSIFHDIYCRAHKTATLTPIQHTVQVKSSPLRYFLEDPAV